MKQRILLIAFIIVSISGFAQDKWTFSNSTPYETVKSHFYFLSKDNYNPKLATYTLGTTDMPMKAKEANVVKLKKIIIKLGINTEDILDRRKGIVEKSKYQLSPKEPLLYLVRKNKKWVYSETTIKSIPLLYKKYVLKIKRPKKVKTISDKKILKNIIEADSNGIEFSLVTPAATIQSHLIFLSDSFFNPSLAAQTIDFAPEDSASAEELAIMLKQLYLGTDVKVFDIDKLSEDTNYIDTLTGKHIYHPNATLPELYLTKIGDKWLYSRATSKLIRSVHEDMYGSDAEDVFRYSDKFKKWAGIKGNDLIGESLKLWQLYMILYFIGLYLLLYLINRIAIRTLLFRIMKSSPFKTVFYQLFSTLTFIILFRIIKTYAPSFELSIANNHILIKTLSLFIIFYSTLLAVYVVNFLKIFFTRGHSYDNRFGIVIFSSLIAKTLILTVSMLFVINTLEYNLINFLAGLSIGGFALAFGAQETVKNFLGSLMIFADKSFRVGDWISNGEVSGTVEEIGLRSTKIRTFHNSIVTVPNSLLSDNNIDNLGRRIYRRYKTKLTITFNTPSSKIDNFTNRISEAIGKHPETRKDFYMVYMNDFNKYGIEVLIYTFFEVSDWNKEMKAKHELIKTILDIKEELGIEFSIPIVAEMDK